MQTITNRQDIDEIRLAATIPAPLVDHVDWYFRQLEAELTEDEGGTFCLDKYGAIILLELGDDILHMYFDGLKDDY